MSLSPGTQTAPRYGVFETSFEAAADHANPPADTEAVAVITRPDGRQWRIGLFWDGGRTWRFRVSPDIEGPWSYQVQSADSGLAAGKGTFSCVSSKLHGALQPMEGFPHHFQYQDGAPVWFYGDTCWRLFCSHDQKKLNRQTIQRYIDRRAAQGYNYIHADMLGYVAKPSAVNEGGSAFLDAGQEEINPAYFQEADERLRYLNSKGIACGLIYAWGQGSVSWATFASDEARLRYARYMTARYAAFNTVLIASGEWGFMKDRKDLFRQLGTEIARCDPHGRMVTIHPGPWDGSNNELAAEPWMCFGEYLQAYRVKDQQVESSPQERDALRQYVLDFRKNGKPVVNAEYGYYLRDQDLDGKVDKQHSQTRESFRQATWMMPMAGAYFVTGFGTTYFGGHRDTGIFNPDAEQNLPAEADLQNVRTFFNALKWWQFEPVEGLARADGIDDKPAYAYCLRAGGPSGTHIVYVHQARGATLRPAAAGPGGWSVRRYDPRTGQYAQQGPVAGGAIELSPPDAQDWVFIVEPAGK